MSDAHWENYEQVSRYLLNRFKEELGRHFDCDFDDIEAKQKLEGTSGTTWEVDAKAVCNHGDRIILIECKRHQRRIIQDVIAALAFKIRDCGASSGIIVSPLGLQEGARKVAETNHVLSVQLSANATESEFILRLQGLLAVGIIDSVTVSASVTAVCLEEVRND